MHRGENVTRARRAIAVACASVAFAAAATGTLARDAGAVSPVAGSPAAGVTSPAADAPATGPVTVGIKPLDPFVVRSGTSDYSGFSIELWDEIARRNGWQSTYTWRDTLAPLLQDVAAGKVDAAIAGISITREREATFDFSYPMFNAGLQVMVGQTRSQGWTDQLRTMVNGTLLRYLAAMAAALLVVANVSWLATRRHRRRDGSPVPYVHGVGHEIYKAAAVGLAGDVGSSEARGPIGRLASMVWLIVGIVFVSLFTATITSQLTVRSIRTGITGVSDLPGKRVVTVKGTTAATYLTNHQIAFTTVDRIDDAYVALDAGQADAIVFDAPVLQHRAQTVGGRRETLVGGIFQREDYGIALPTGSALRKPINETILAMRADGTYDRLYEHYFGATNN